MFTITTPGLSHIPFIHRAEHGFVTHFPAIRVCQIQFDRRHYRDELYEILSVPFPPQLRPAIIRRRAEYLAGRYAAQILLREQGCHDAVVMQHNRIPQWPTGWYGSISHSEDHAIAVISRQSAKLIPGIDIERRCPAIMNEIAHTFISPQERSVLNHCNIEHETALLITFSAKESLYKALSPQALHEEPSFKTATLFELDTRQQRFCLRLQQTLSPSLPAGKELIGHYAFQGDNVITLITSRCDTSPS